MDGYYDPIVTHVLKRPLCICGYYGSRSIEVASFVAGYSGIPFADLERNIEHRLGCNLYDASSPECIEKEEYACLRSIIKSRPYSVVALRPQTLSSARVAKLIHKKADLIYIKGDIFLIFGRVLDLLERVERTRYLNFDGYDPRNIRSLNVLMMKHAQEYSKAKWIIDIERIHPREVAQEILQKLPAIY